MYNPVRLGTMPLTGIRSCSPGYNAVSRDTILYARVQCHYPGYTPFRLVKWKKLAVSDATY